MFQAFNKYAALAAENAARQESHKKEKESSKPNVVAGRPIMSIFFLVTIN
jgi:hypothetical protein